MRPLGLGDIFNAAFAYIRLNPKATLGFTAIVIVLAHAVALVFTAVIPLAAYGGTLTAPAEDASGTSLAGTSLSGLVGTVATSLAGVVLSGMLTVIVGRAVFAAPITIGQAWDRIRGRIWALLGLMVLEALGAIAIVGVGVVIIVIAVALNPVLGFLIAAAIVLGLIAVFVYLWTALALASPAIVLERLPVLAAIRRSFGLVHGSFWRVFGIRALAALVAAAVTYAVEIPFVIGALAVGIALHSTLGAAAVAAAGNAIGQIITAPFIAGVVVLLYTDRRMRAEAFDLVLQTGAAGDTDESADSTDHLWLIRHP